MRAELLFPNNGHSRAAPRCIECIEWNGKKEGSAAYMCRMWNLLSEVFVCFCARIKHIEISKACRSMAWLCNEWSSSSIWKALLSAQLLSPINEARTGGNKSENKTFNSRHNSTNVSLIAPALFPSEFIFAGYGFLFSTKYISHLHTYTENFFYWTSVKFYWNFFNWSFSNPFSKKNVYWIIQ